MDIEKFCSTFADPRDYLSAPFRLDGLTVATDGFCLVLGPDDETAHVCDAPDDVVAAFRAIVANAAARSYCEIPALLLPPSEACRRCSGSGNVSVTTCRECQGDGDVEAETAYNTYLVDCMTCDGTGEEKGAGGPLRCDECAGQGKSWPPYQNIEVLGVSVQVKYLSRLDGLDGIAWSADTVLHRVFFRAGQYSGCIMGMRPPTFRAEAEAAA